MSEVKRRDDIDGLRAVAVLLVLLFHAQVGPFTGGFVGVDVFFVISGYLITGIIASALVRSQFSLLYFYRRRLLRIAPAAVTVVLCTFVASLFILPPEEMRLFGNSIIAAAASVANLYFWGSAGYFDTASEWKPLLHLWSLSVEEQFYIVVPLSLIVLKRIGWKAMRPAVVIAFIASLAWSQWSVSIDPTAAFFSIQSRAWELLLGSILAVGILPTFPRAAQASATFCGAVMIFSAAFLFHDTTPFPGASALLPCIGTLLIIWAGEERRENLARQALSIPPMTYVGRISYSLYLWHWPILVLSTISAGRPLTMVETCAALAATFILAALSYRFVEQPFTGPQHAEAHLGWGKAKISFRVFAALALLGLTGAAGLATRFTAGFPARASEEALAANSAMSDLSSFARPCFSSGAELRGPRGCLSGHDVAAGKYDVIVWGDSHAEHIFPAIAEAALRSGRTARLIAKSACPPLLNVRANIQNEPEAADLCSGFVRAARAEIESQPASTMVVLASAWSDWTRSHYLTDKDHLSENPETTALLLASSLHQTVASLSEERPVLIVRQTPVFQSDPARCGARAGMLGRATKDCYVIPKEDALSILAESNKAIDDAVADANVSVLDPFDWLCDENSCFAKAQDTVLYRDKGHLSSTGSRWLGQHIELPRLAR